MKIIYALYRSRNGGKYVHSRLCGSSLNSLYMLRISSKAGLSKDQYSKVKKTCGIKISEDDTRSAVLCSSGFTFVDKMDQFISSSICRQYAD